MTIHLSQALKIATISRVLVIFWAVLGFYLFPLQTHEIVGLGETHQYIEQEAVLVNIEDIFVKWDTNHYLNIINNGYDDPNIEGFNPSWNFLPSYPSVLYILTLGGLIKSKAVLTLLGLAFSNAMFLLAIKVLVDVMRKLSYDKLIIPTVTLLSFYPGSLYFSFLYTESLFLLLLISGYYFLLNKNLWYSTILFGLAMITRKVGLFLPLIYVFELLKDIRLSSLIYFTRIHLKHLVVMVLPLLAFAAYLSTITGDLLTLYKSQNEWTNIPPVPLAGIYGMFIDPRFTNVFQIGVWFFFMAILFVYRKKIQPSLLFYTGVCMIFITATGQAQGYVRYFSVLFPLFILLANLKDNHKATYNFVLYGFVSGLSVWTIMFVNDFSFAI